LAGVVYQFGDFSLDCGKFQLSRKGRPLRLERKPLELLILLVAKHGQVVNRDEIALRLWEEKVFVDVEHGINTAIRKIRQTLGDDPGQPQFVQTVSGSGYRFIATVTAGPVKETGLAEPLDLRVESPSVMPEAAVKPEAHSSASEVGHKNWLVAAVCVFVLAVVAMLALGRHTLATRFLHPDSHAAIGSIAVLPLQNLSGDPGQEYFADGMTDELITELARIPKLRVVSRTSVMADKGLSRPLPDIARQLDVDAIVEGSIARSGDRIRITAQLIDGRTDRHLWAQSFEGSASDVLSLQDSVAQQIASQASFVLVPALARAPLNPAAHDAYLRGRYFFDKQDFSDSLVYFQQAVGLDPNYASAQAGYASALEANTVFNMATTKQLMPKALAAAERAIQLDPRNGEAYTALGSIETIYEWNWNAAEQNLTRGISLSPSDAVAELKYSVYLDAVGRRQDAITHMRRALQLDPFSFLINVRMGVALYYDRQYDAAIAQLQRAAEMEPQAGSVEAWMSMIYEQKGDQTQAVQHDLVAFHDFNPHFDHAAFLAIYRQHGWQSYWRARNRPLLHDPASSCAAYLIGLNDLRANESDHAFDSLQRAVDGHCFHVAFVRVDPIFDSIRRDPRYAALVARINQ
jgi:TolB-like protein/DNA-binding winged helix-turn-helix (wHTH) protein/tetratricopeptide (TPR) repeat protein